MQRVQQQNGRSCAASVGRGFGSTSRAAHTFRRPSVTAAANSGYGQCNVVGPLEFGQSSGMGYQQQQHAAYQQPLPYSTQPPRHEMPGGGSVWGGGGYPGGGYTQPAQHPVQPPQYDAQKGGSRPEGLYDLYCYEYKLELEKRGLSINTPISSDVFRTQQIGRIAALKCGPIFERFRNEATSYQQQVQQLRDELEGFKQREQRLWDELANSRHREQQLWDELASYRYREQQQQQWLNSAAASSPASSSPATDAGGTVQGYGCGGKAFAAGFKPCSPVGSPGSKQKQAAGRVPDAAVETVAAEGASVVIDPSTLSQRARSLPQLQPAGKPLHQLASLSAHNGGASGGGGERGAMGHTLPGEGAAAAEQAAGAAAEVQAAASQWPRRASSSGLRLQPEGASSNGASSSDVTGAAQPALVLEVAFQQPSYVDAGGAGDGSSCGGSVSVLSWETSNNSESDANSEIGGVSEDGDCEFVDAY